MVAKELFALNGQVTDKAHCLQVLAGDAGLEGVDLDAAETLLVR